MILIYISHVDLKIMFFSKESASQRVMLKIPPRILKSHCSSLDLFVPSPSLCNSNQSPNALCSIAHTRVTL